MDRRVAEEDGELRKEPGAGSQKPEWRVWVLLCAAILLPSCAISPEARLRKTLATQTTGVIRLPPGFVEISSELRLAPGAHDLEIVGAGTMLKATDEFKGRAVLVAEGGQRIRMHDFSIDGNRVVLEKPLAMAPPENAFRIYYPNNGLLVDRVQSIEVSDVHFGNIINFPIVISRSADIRIRRVVVEESGSRNARGRNNTTGGIVIEEGSSNFEVSECTFRRIRGNGLWTHSLYTSPRSLDGLFSKNRFDSIGRDALQVGHATRVRVEDNTGIRIGFPSEAVDVENGGTPVGIDTSGNVDHSTYERNQFEEVNGKCIDLDGFHDGSVRENRCVNRRPPQEYPFGHFGIVMNNTDPNMQSQNIEITGNTIDGTKFGGVFLIGSGHRIVGNVFLHLNKAECNESGDRFGCIYKKDEPQMLESGIYLGRGVARMEDTRGNVIRENRISGHKMKTRCVVAGPGVSLGANTIAGNTCSDYTLAR